MPDGGGRMYGGERKKGRGKSADLLCFVPEVRKLKKVSVCRVPNIVDGSDPPEAGSIENKTRIKDEYPMLEVGNRNSVSLSDFFEDMRKNSIEN